MDKKYFQQGEANGNAFEFRRIDLFLWHFNAKYAATCFDAIRLVEMIH